MAVQDNERSASDENGGSDSTSFDLSILSGPFHRLAKLLRVDAKDLGVYLGAVIITLVTVSHYIFTMLQWTNPGFTLDDSWIHLQFARTIYEGTPWEYSPGYPCTGSTSPLWSIILASLFFITSDPTGLVWGTYFISTLFYVGSTLIVGKLTTNYTGNHIWAYLGMIGFVMVPRNTWLMLSGMETPLFMFILLLAIYLLDKPGPKYDVAIGLVSGLAFLSRPEGILIILVCVPVRFFLVLENREFNWRRLGSFILLGGAAFLIALPWILYCLSVTGLPLPDTFYAKVHVPTEFEVEVWNFWWAHFLLEMPFIILGAILGVVLAIKGKPFPWMLALSMTILYRLSAPYSSLINNARYLVPVFNLFVVVAISAIVLVLQGLNNASRKPFDRPTVNGLVCLLIVALVITPISVSYLNQAPFYGNAVKNINEQQVHIGMWLADNTPANSVLAIHDAGALRFFSNRTIIDLAGLVSPDIIHGNMSTIEIIRYLKNHSCNYFVFFNELMYGFRGHLPGATTILYTVHLSDNVISGRDTMSVYFINWTLAPWV